MSVITRSSSLEGFSDKGVNFKILFSVERLGSTIPNLCFLLKLLKYSRTHSLWFFSSLEELFWEEDSASKISSQKKVKKLAFSQGLLLANSVPIEVFLGNDSRYFGESWECSNFIGIMMFPFFPEVLPSSFIRIEMIWVTLPSGGTTK